MSSNLFSKTKENYGNEYEKHLFEQYQLYVESAEKISDRRQNVISYFITINTAIIALLGLPFQIDFFEKFSWARVLLPILGIIIAIIFCLLLHSYKQLNSGKFEVIHTIEKELPLSLYDYEWEILGKGEDRKLYFLSSHIESYIPLAFIVLYLVLGLVFCIN